MKCYDVYWCELGPYRDCIQGGTRPAIVLGNFKGLRNSPIITVIPITTKIKRLDMKSHVLGYNYQLRKPCMALCEQIQTVTRTCIGCRHEYVKFDNRKITIAIKEALGIEI